jgi:hypothetical protein
MMMIWGLAPAASSTGEAAAGIAPVSGKYGQMAMGWRDRGGAGR